MPGKKLAAIERSYRRTALPFPHPTGWGNSFWRRRDVAEGKDLNLEKR
ncbi:hypothetical protein P4H71_01980 [Paenibacillus kribbensis]|nr:hypothetical protein [Paenibacillus kribbensis]MEC0233126.1 hypothetical protein [Paenibacillus kribbensis]